MRPRANGQPCVAARDCEENCIDGVCVTFIGRGETCETGDCAPGLRCQDGRCRGLGQLGEPCERGEPSWLGSVLLPDDCDPQLTCIDGRCIQAACGPARLGDVCSALTRCPEGICKNDGRCHAFSKLGEPCEQGCQEKYGISCCVSGSCDAESGRCVEQAPPPSPCGSCPPGTHCEAPGCVPDVCDGETP